jgi:hypothetical protein
MGRPAGFSTEELNVYRLLTHAMAVDYQAMFETTFGKINSATPLKMLGNRLETNATTIGSEINAKMPIFTFSRAHRFILTDFHVRLYSSFGHI